MLNVSQMHVSLEQFAPAPKSFCVAHAVWSGPNRGFELNRQIVTRPRAVDRVGIPYVVVNVRKSKEVAKRVIREGYDLPMISCPHCGKNMVKLPRLGRCRINIGGCGELLHGGREFVRHFVVADGYVRQGDGCTLFLFDGRYPSRPKNPDEFKAAVGIASKCNGEADDLKFQKYFKRRLANVQSSVSGPVTKLASVGFEATLVRSVKGELVSKTIRVFTPTVEGTEVKLMLGAAETAALALAGISYRYDEATGETCLPAELFYDGGFLINTTLASWLLDRAVDDGEGLQMTIGTPTRTYKGLAECDSRLAWDAVLFMGKKQLVNADNTVTFQIMQELHPSHQEFTDVQSVVALDQAAELDGWAVEAMKAFQASLSDTSKVNNNLENIMAAMSEEDLNDQDEPCWSLIRAYRAGLPVNLIPWARRRLISFFSKKMINMSGKFRVPLPSWAIGAYAAVDRSARDENGIIHPERARLAENECVIPSASNVGRVGMIRRPMEHKGAQTIMNQVQYPRFMTLASSCPYVFLPLGAIPVMGPRHGGFDFDDRFQIVQNEAEIERREKSLASKPYPAVPLKFDDKQDTPKADQVVVNALLTNPWARAKAERAARLVASDPFEPLRRMVSRQMGRQAGLSIGRVSNDIIIDSDNWNNGKIRRPKLYRVASNLEAVIDRSVHVQKEGDLEEDAVMQDIKVFEETVACCDAALADRLPKKERERVPLFEGRLSAARKTVDIRKKQFLADLADEGVDLITSAVPAQLESVISTTGASELLAEINIFWAERMGANRKLVVADVNAEFEDEGEDLKDPIVQAKMENKIGLETFYGTQRDLFMQFDGAPHLYQAVAMALRNAYCDRRGGDGRWSGDHTVAWFIKVWNALQAGGDPAKIGIQTLGKLTTHQEAARTRDIRVSSPVVGLFTIVDGLQTKYGDAHHEAVVAFRGHAGEEVVLEQCLHLNKEDGEYENAVLAMRPGPVLNLAGGYTDDDVRDAYGAGKYIGYVVRGEVGRFVKSGQNSVHATLRAGSAFTLKAALNA